MRWLLDPPADGASNMARDEAILLAVGEGRSPPTLRFYGWSTPTISLGYFQSYADFEAVPAPAGDLPVVRRLTGGGAILHDRELTYSLTLPIGHPWLADGGPHHLYERIHGLFARWLASYGVPVTRGPADSRGCSHRGPFFCFERHCGFDLMADGRKLMGSAQRRTRTAVLQHGSLILQSRFDQQVCAAVSMYTGTEDVMSSASELVRAIVGGEGEPGRLAPHEAQLADRLREKYAGSAWTQRR